MSINGDFDITDWNNSKKGKVTVKITVVNPGAKAGASAGKLKDG